jgi:hypothetical protein
MDALRLYGVTTFNVSNQELNFVSSRLCIRADSPSNEIVCLVPKNPVLGHHHGFTSAMGMKWCNQTQTDTVSLVPSFQFPVPGTRTPPVQSCEPFPWV